MDPYEIYAEVWKISNKMKNQYDEFWRRIYYDDSFVFYKHALMYYLKLQNGKYHNAFGRIMNKVLYQGHCNILSIETKQDFTSDDISLTLPTSDILCDLSYQIINILDRMFRICPPVPFNVIVYRYEYREHNDQILQIKKGDFYYNRGFMSTTINPWYTFSKSMVMSSDENIFVSFTILIPQYSKGCYVNTSTWLSYKKSDLLIRGDQSELILPRNCLFEILSIKKIGTIVMIEMILRYQDFSEDDKVIFTKKEVEHLEFIKSDLKTFDARFRKIRNVLLNLYQSYEPPVDYYPTFYDEETIKKDEISDWIIAEPDYKNINLPREDVNYLYKGFLNNIRNMITVNDTVIYLMTDWFSQKWLTEKINNTLIKSEKSIQISYPLIFDLKLDASAYANPLFFVYEGDNSDRTIHDQYLKMNEKYPLFIITKLRVNKMEYIPLGLGRGFTIDIDKINILKCQKWFLSDYFFFYTCTSSSQISAHHSLISTE